MSVKRQFTSAARRGMSSPIVTASRVSLPTEIRSGHTSEAITPPLKWAGGKRWQVPHLRPYWAHHGKRRLVEPFSGGLAVTLSLRPGEALLNDINPHVINLYQWIGKGLCSSVRMANDEALFYRQRDRFNRLVVKGRADTAEAASLFYYLNRTGFNGLCRFNKSGGFNVPFGRYSQVRYTRDFTDLRPAFSRWEFVSGDFAELAVMPTDFIYADPPYDVEFTSYAKEGFAWSDQRRLALWLADHPGPVILANQATPRIVRLYRKLGFTIRFLDAPRKISCTGDRTPAREILAFRNVL
jgi:DNA adenine methylase